jgi:hypothetical protein
VNPFIPKPFAAPNNKILENYKRNVKIALITKVNKLGGTVASWIREAFVTWDPFYTGKISDYKQLQGASKRLGVAITEEEAKELIHCYDRDHTHEMHYNYLTKVSDLLSSLFLLTSLLFCLALFCLFAVN